MDKQSRVKKAAIVVLVSLVNEAENKSSEKSKIEIRKAVEEALARIPWVVVENVIIVKE